MGLAMLAAAPASAQTSAYNAADVGLPTIAVPGGVLSASGARVLGLQISQPAPVATGGQASVSGLAFTGSDVITLLMIAIPLIVIGATLTRHARPRRASQG